MKTYVLYVGNGWADPSLNTEQGARDVQVLSNFLRGYCYRQFHGGQMEQVLDELVSIAYVKTMDEVKTIITELRKLGVEGVIRIETEYD